MRVCMYVFCTLNSNNFDSFIKQAISKSVLSEYNIISYFLYIYINMN